MTEYTPTTADVRDEWALSFDAGTMGDARAAFDRWLADVKAAVWHEATDYDLARAVVRACEGGGDHPVNPYRRTSTVRLRE